MKKILLTVIFFLLCLILFLIYNKFGIDRQNILYVGDVDIYNIFFDKTNYFIDKYTFNNITYKDLRKKIIDNSSKVIKDKNIYLNQLISKSDIIILSANNFKYKKKCNKSEKIIKEYDDIVVNDINNLVLLINKISNSKIYIIGNNCENSDIHLNLSFDNVYYINYNNVDNIFNIIQKTTF